MFPGYIVYEGYTSLKSILESSKVVAGIIGRVIPGPVIDVIKKAQDLSSAVHESVGPGLGKVPEELSKTIQAISGEVGKAADGAKNAVISPWEWVKKEVEGRKK